MSVIVCSSGWEEAFLSGRRGVFEFVTFEAGIKFEADSWWWIIVSLTLYLSPLFLSLSTTLSLSLPLSRVYKLKLICRIWRTLVDDVDDDDDVEDDEGRILLFIKAVQLLTWGTGVGVVDKWFTRWVTTSVIRL